MGGGGSRGRGAAMSFVVCLSEQLLQPQPQQQLYHLLQLIQVQQNIYDYVCNLKEAFNKCYNEIPSKYSKPFLVGWPPLMPSSRGAVSNRKNGDATKTTSRVRRRYRPGRAGGKEMVDETDDAAASLGGLLLRSNSPLHGNNPNSKTHRLILFFTISISSVNIQTYNDHLYKGQPSYELTPPVIGQASNQSSQSTTVSSQSPKDGATTSLYKGDDKQQSTHNEDSRSTLLGKGGGFGGVTTRRTSGGGSRGRGAAMSFVGLFLRAAAPASAQATTISPTPADPSSTNSIRLCL